MSPEERETKRSILKELLEYLKAPERKALFEAFCEKIPNLRGLNLSKVDDKTLGDTYNNLFNLVQHIRPEHERSAEAKELNFDTYGKLCNIAKATKHPLSSQDVLPYRLRKDQLEKLNYFLKQIREDAFTIGDYEALFTNDNLLKGMLSPEERSDLVLCIDRININKLLIRGTPPKPNPVQTKDEEGGREMEKSNQSRSLTHQEIEAIRSKFSRETTPITTIQPDQVVINKRIKVEDEINKTITDISGLVTVLMTNKLTFEAGKSVKSEYDGILNKFKEITSDKYRKQIVADLRPKHTGLPLKVMTENRIRYALESLKSDVQDLNRRATEIASTVSKPQGPTKAG